MPSKKTRKGKIVWLGVVNKPHFRKEKSFKTRTEANKWEQAIKSLLASAIPVDFIKDQLHAGIMPEAIPEIWNQLNEVTRSISLLEWANDYLGAVQNISPKTLDEKKTVFKEFFKFVNPRETVIQDLTPGLALDFLNIPNKKVSGHKANKARKNLIAAWNWGIKFRGFPEKNPFLKVDKYRHDSNPHYVPPVEDFFKVLDYAGPQDKVILLTFLHTAGRKSEIYGLTWEDVDFSPHEPRIRLKTRKTRDGSIEEVWLPMTDELLEALQQHKAQSKSKWVFVVEEGRYAGQPFGARRTFPKNLCRRVKVKPFGHHGIRGLSSSLLALNDVPMKVIQQVLRHKQLATTERYVRGLAPVRPYLTVLEGGAKEKKRNVA